MTSKLLSMLVFTMLFVNMSANAQASGRQRTVLQFNDFVSSLNGATNRTAHSAATHIRSLVKDSQPAVYLKSAAQVEVYGDNPVSLYTDASMLAMLRNGSAPAFPKDNIEIVTLKVSPAQLSAGIDLSSFASFPNLKYIYINAEGNSTAQSIAGSIQNDNPTYSVFYDLTKIN